LLLLRDVVVVIVANNVSILIACSNS